MNSTVKMRTSRRGSFWVSIGIAAALVATAPATAFATTSPSPSITSNFEGMSEAEYKAAVESSVAKLREYTSADVDGKLHFDIEAARKAGADSNTLRAGAGINRLAVVNSSSAGWNGRVSSPAQGATTNSKFYGNWCGPNYGSGTPVDLLDSYCKTHDLCYRARGRDACSCDSNLIDSIGRNLGRMGTLERAAGFSILTTFTVRRSSGGCDRNR